MTLTTRGSFILLLFLLLAPDLLHGQEKPLYRLDVFKPVKPLPRNELNVNLFGYSSIISFTYGRLFHLKNGRAIACGSGVGLNPQSDIDLFGPETSAKTPADITIPVYSVYCFGTGNSAMEVGAGVTFNYYGVPTVATGYPLIGFRYYSPKYHNNFRMFFSYPFSGKLSREGYVFIPFAICVGGSF